MYIYVCICECIYIYVCVYLNSAIDKEENTAICGTMNESEDTLISEINQTQKDRYCVNLCIYGI